LAVKGRQSPPFHLGLDPPLQDNLAKRQRDNRIIARVEAKLVVRR
jgi:hypothetical protein